VAGNAKTGSDWGDGELDAIVADYFAMLELELAGQSYVKSHRGAALMQTLGRSHRSVEFKHMNISAVMSTLGRPIIKGYRPLYNIQRAIYDAIDRYLTQYPQTLDLAPAPSPVFSEPHVLYEESVPVLRPPKADQAPRMKALVRKFDPSLRDFRNRDWERPANGLSSIRRSRASRSSAASLSPRTSAGYRKRTATALATTSIPTSRPVKSA
jgi:hypothetical protein